MAARHERMYGTKEKEGSNEAARAAKGTPEGKDVKERAPPPERGSDPEPKGDEMAGDAMTAAHMADHAHLDAKHVGEHMMLRAKHATERAHGDSPEMHDKHEEEMRSMHREHHGELRKLHEKHEGGESPAMKMIDKAA